MTCLTLVYFTLNSFINFEVEGLAKVCVNNTTSFPAIASILLLNAISNSSQDADSLSTSGPCNLFESYIDKTDA